MLLFIPYTNISPKCIIVGKEALAIFLPLLSRTGSLGGTVFKNDLGLSQIFPQRLPDPEKDQGGIGHLTINCEFCIFKQLFSGKSFKGLIA